MSYVQAERSTFNAKDDVKPRIVKFVVMEVRHVCVCADECNLDWCEIIAERYFSCTNRFVVYVLYKENNLTVSCVSDDHKAGEYNGWPHYKSVNIIISKACA